jgi:hypothetical protein
MSIYSVSPCNFCYFERIKKQTNKETQRLIAEPGKKGGTVIYRVPHPVEFEKLSDSKKEEYFVAWFKKLPKKCSC